MSVRINNTMLSVYTNVKQHLSRWTHGKTAPSLRVVLAGCTSFYSNNSGNWGWRFLPVQRESKELIIQKRERPLQPEPALGSCRQLSGNGQRAIWEAGKRPSSKPVCCCCQRSAWKLTAQYPPAATHILHVSRGGCGSRTVAERV